MNNEILQTIMAVLGVLCFGWPIVMMFAFLLSIRNVNFENQELGEVDDQTEWDGWNEVTA
jgi:hypothetical protein